MSPDAGALGVVATASYPFCVYVLYLIDPNTLTMRFPPIGPIVDPTHNNGACGNLSAVAFAGSDLALV